jgi:radical SAM superfamily enzyme YgiQ (UPF0313 family)
MPTEELAAICRFAWKKFPGLQRITVYGSSQYVARKGFAALKYLREAGLSRIHVGLESGDDEILKRVKKGTHASEQIEAGRMMKEAGIQISEYVILGLGGLERSESHALATAEAINAIEPDFIRLRTLVPKLNTLLLHQIKKGRFQLLTPYQVLVETRHFIENLRCRSSLMSDHYTNYLYIAGNLPDDRERLLGEIDDALRWDESRFRSFFIGTE